MTQATTATEAPAKSTSFYILSAIGAVIMFGFGYLPPVAPLTKMGMEVVGIFLGLIFYWTFVGLLWPSLLGLLALGLSDALTLNKVLSTAFGAPIMVLFLMTMVLFGAFQHYGVSRYIGYWFLTRKIINGKPVVFSFVFMYTAYLISALVSILPSLLLMWSILYSLLKDVGYKKGEAYTNLMVSGVLFGAMSGQAAKPFVGTPLIVLSSYEKVAGMPMDYLPYMTYGFIMSTIVLLVYALVIKFILRPDMSKIADISIEQFTKNPLPPMDKRQKVLLASLFSYFGLILLPSLLPLDILPIIILKKLGPVGLTIGFLVGLNVYKINGEPCVEFKAMAGKYIIWDVFCLGAMAVVIAGVLSNPATGLTAFLTELFSPLLTSASGYVSMLLILLFGMGITQVANNAVMAAVLMPVIGVFCEQTGMSFAGAATFMTFAMHVAILSPAASPYAAMLYANKDWMDKDAVLKSGLRIFFTCLVVYAVVGIPLMEIIF